QEDSSVCRDQLVQWHMAMNKCNRAAVTKVQHRLIIGGDTLKLSIENHKGFLWCLFQGLENPGAFLVPFGTSLDWKPKMSGS
ncbi:MAG: hypothetical protein L7W94_05265, partial [Alphaproteobacteria bacterium]|nr:hypothetical protein [Alphaproteobacteria bacterium]